MFKQIAEAINNSKKIIILPHKSADGDCLGSAFALKLMLQNIGKEVVVLLEEKPFPRICNIVFGVEDEREIENDLVICVDCGDKARLGDRISFFEKGCNTINIDHHPTNTNFATQNYVNPTAAATGEIIFELAQYMNIEINHEIATNIYIAIASDTGGFSYSNTKPKTHRIAAELLETGFDNASINQFLFDSNSMTRLMLMKEALNSLEVYANGKIAIVSITEEQMKNIGAEEDDAGGLISLARSLDTAKISLCIKEQNGGKEVKVSMRSNIIDVSELSKKFGGGGHVRASGCTINADIKTAREMLLSEIEKQL